MSVLLLSAIMFLTIPAHADNNTCADGQIPIGGKCENGRAEPIDEIVPPETDGDLVITLIDFLHFFRVL